MFGLEMSKKPLPPVGRGVGNVVELGFKASSPIGGGLGWGRDRTVELPTLMLVSKQPDGICNPVRNVSWQAWFGRHKTYAAGLKTPSRLSRSC